VPEDARGHIVSETGQAAPGTLGEAKPGSAERLERRGNPQLDHRLSQKTWSGVAREALSVHLDARGLRET